MRLGREAEADELLEDSAAHRESSTHDRGQRECRCQAQAAVAETHDVEEATPAHAAHVAQTMRHIDVDLMASLGCRRAASSGVSVPLEAEASSATASRLRSRSAAVPSAKRSSW